MLKKPVPYKSNKEEVKAKQKEQQVKKEAYRQFMLQFKPLLIAVSLWFIINAVLHLPAIKDDVMELFVRFTLNSALAFGKLLFIPVESHSYPMITVGGYTMKVIMECTAYNFYIFVICLSLLSPVKWKQRLLTLLIFVTAVFVINNFRFYTLGFIARHFSQLFDSIHDYLWNILFGFLVFLIWLWRFRVQKTDVIPET